MTSSNSMKELEEVASILLREGLHVTALELNSELHRSRGRELRTIRNYFSNPKASSSSSFHPNVLSATLQSNSIGRRSNSPSLNDSEYPQPRLPTVMSSPGNRAASTTASNSNSGIKHARSPSIQTFDSLDFARGSDDGVEKSIDKIAVLEFELRKAKETIKSLRTSLTIATIESSSESGNSRQEVPAGTRNPPASTFSDGSDVRREQQQEEQLHQQPGDQRTDRKFNEQHDGKERHKNEAASAVASAVNEASTDIRSKRQNTSASGTCSGSHSEGSTSKTNNMRGEDGKEDSCIRGMRGSDTTLPCYSDLLMQVKDIDSSIKPHEKRAVNFLVHEFLMKNAARMTAVTLSEEINDQDFENWHDVGLNVQKPPDLLQLYRFFVWSANHLNRVTHTSTLLCNDNKKSLQRSSSSSCSNLQDAASQTDVVSRTKKDHKREPNAGTKGENTAGPHPASSSIDRFASSSTSSSDHKHRIRLGDRDFEDDNEDNDDDGDDDEEDNRGEGQQESTRSEPNVHPIIMRMDQGTQTDRLLSFFKRTSGDELEETGIEEEVEEKSEKLQLSAFQRVFVEESGLLSSNEIHFEIITDRQHLIQLLAYDFPQIVANYKPDQRSDLFPILVSTIYLNPDHESRACLLNNFFNLIEKPNHCERRMILSAFVSLARKLSVKDVEEDLLPLVWEQINHKSVERRILVTESCADLLPLVSSGIRVSLIYSILSQILQEEKDLHVRESAIRVFSFLLTIFTSERNDDKYDPVVRQILIPTIHELERLTSCSGSQDDSLLKSVSSFRKTVIKYFIPSVCYWSFHLDKLFTLTNELLSHVKLLLAKTKSPSQESTSLSSENSAVIFMNSLEIAIPFLFVSLIHSLPAASSSPSSDTSPASTHSMTSTASSAAISKKESHRYCFISNKLLNMNLISNEGEPPVKELIIRFDQYISRDWFKPWPVWEEMFERSFLPVIVNQIIPSIPLDQTNLLSACISFCSSFGQHFGLTVIRSKAKPIFLKNIYMKMNDLSSALLPSFASLLISIKPIQEEEKRDLSNCLAKSLINLSLESCPPTTTTASSSTSSSVTQASGGFGSSSASVLNIRSIEMTINYLVNESHSELTRCDINRCILQFLSETSSHQHPNVKKNSCRILNSFIVSNFAVNLGNDRFTELIHELLRKDSILDSLSIDNDIEVRSLTIPAYGSLYILMHEQLNRIKGFDEGDVKRIMDQINTKLNFFLEDPINRDQHMIHLELISIFARIARSCSLLNLDSVTITAKSFLDFSLPRIAALTVQTRSNVSLQRSKKQELVLALIDSYTKFSFIPIGVNEQLIRESILPSLKLMREEVLEVAPEYEETIVALMAEFDKRLHEPASGAGGTSASTASVAAHGIESLISKSMSLHRLKRESFTASSSATLPSHTISNSSSVGSTVPSTNVTSNVGSSISSHQLTSLSSTPPLVSSTGVNPSVTGAASASPVMDELKTRFRGLFKKQ